MPVATADPHGPPPPFDGELAPAVARVRAIVDAPLTPAKIGAARQRSTAAEIDDARIAALGFGTEEIIGAGDRREARGSRLLLCRPTNGPASSGLIFHIHGGGMVAGSWRSDELGFDLLRAKQLGLSVISVDYRLAPENPFPLPLDDCYHQLAWIEAEASHLGLDSDRIVLSGNSAGGGLAAWLALRRRDSGNQAVRGVMLQCPMLDARCDSVSARQMHSRGVWDTVSNRTGWAALLRGTDSSDEAADAVVTPALYANLAGLPPVFIDVGSAESLREEAVQFASRIWEAGGVAELHVWAGGFHSFDQWVPGADVSRAAEAARMSWLRRVMS